MGKSISITFEEDLLKELDSKIAKENKTKTKDKTTRSKLLAEAFQEYNNPKKAVSPQVVEKEVIVEVEKIIEKEVPIFQQPVRERGLVEKFIDDTDTTTKIVWIVLLLGILIF
ncbi:MAG: hypothetical protein ISR69_00435 [Gammaproteobacteria bacterium]|nr:hypothetical protein [Gammaproteobacteria bacterium]